ncbi:MAG TPA: shikimate dehydrogenase [Flavobacterium sp.]|jgi:shikimate dehydrogenase
MEEEDNSKRQYGLIGRNINYSFSKKYFTKKFADLKLERYSYENFDLADVSEFRQILTDNPDLAGLNVTVPYKQQIIPLLDTLSGNAAKMGAVNTIRVTNKGTLKGYNTDWYGFSKSLKPMLQPHHQKALILGTGGASKAVAFALDKLGILYTFVSREESAGAIRYDFINATTFDNHQIIINCTPLGTSPDTAEFPPIPYEFFTEKHIAYDLIYNPEETVFLKKAKASGAIIKNGYEMLVLQAERSWKIWNR